MQIRNPDDFWALPDAAIEEWLAYDGYVQGAIEELVRLLSDKPESQLTPEAWALFALARLGG